MAKYSNPEIAAAYERGVQAGVLQGPALKPEGYANLLSTLGQNIAGMAKEAQKATTAEVTAILDGISKVEASAQAGVDAKAMDMWQNYQDNLTKLQTAAAQVDNVVLRKAAEEATNIVGKQDVNDTGWRREYLKSIVTQLQDGSGRPFLYGTMQAAMSTLGYVDPNTGAITPGKMAEAVTLIDSLEDPHLKSLAKSLFQNYTSQGTYYSGVQEELQRLNEMLGAVEASGLSPEDWYKNNRAQWEKFVHAHDQFRAKTLPYLTDKNGAFYADLKATIAPEMSEALAYQQGFYEGLTGSGGAATDRSNLQYKLARYISSPAAQRTAADWGFNIGRIVPVTDESQKAMILRQFPTGVYFEDLGGIYVPGPDDRTMAKWAAKREDRSDPRGTLLEQAFGRHYRKETEYVDLTLKGPASSAGAKPTAEPPMPFSKGWTVSATTRTWTILTGTRSTGETVWVRVDRTKVGAEIEIISEADAKRDLQTKEYEVDPLRVDDLTPGGMKALGLPPYIPSSTIATGEAGHPWSEGYTYTVGSESFHLLIGKKSDGSYNAVQVRDRDGAQTQLTEAQVSAVLKKVEAVKMPSVKPEDLDALQLPRALKGPPPGNASETPDKKKSEAAAPVALEEPEKTPPAKGETLRNVQVVPARTGDPIGSINIIDPLTGEIRNISAEEVEDIVTVGGGGERQDLQTFVKRVRALRSQARGIAAANKSAATAAEHPESAAYSSTRATDAAEAFRSDETRGGKVWNEARKRWEVPTPLEPVKAEPVPDISTPQAEVMKAAAQSGPTTPGPRRFQFGDATYYWYPPGAEAPGGSRYYVQDRTGFRAATESDMMAFSEGQNTGAVKETTVQVPVPAPASPVEALPENTNPPQPTYYQLGNALYTFWPADPSDPASQNRYIVRDEQGTRLATEEDMMAFSEGLNRGIAKEVPAPAPAPVQPPAPAPLPSYPAPGHATGLGSDTQVAPPTFKRGLIAEPPARPPSAAPLDATGRLMDGSPEDTDQKQKQNEQERKREQKQKEDEAKYSIGGIPSDVEVAPLPGTPGEEKIEPLPGTSGEGEITPMSGDKTEKSGKAEPKPTDKRTASLKAFVSGYNRAPSSATVPPAGGNPGYPNAVKQVADTRYS